MELNEANAIEIFHIASSNQRDDNQRSAETQIRSWESSPGALYIFQRIYNSQQLPLQTRWLAIICLKNGIEKNWKKTRLNAVGDQEKSQIRRGLFDSLNESNNQLAIQNAHSIARIARFDFPMDWPTLFEDVIQILELNSELNSISIIKINNLMIILNQVIKNLAAVRIGKARVAMQAKIPLVVPHLIKFYHLFFDIWLKDLNNIAVMEVGYLCLKNIRRCIVDGYANSHREKSIQDFFSTSLEHLQKLLLAHESNQMDSLERYIKCHIKLYHNLVMESPTSFILMPASKNILLTLLSLLQQKASSIYNSQEDSDGEFWEKIAIKSFLTLKKLTSFTYKKGATVIRQKSDKEEIDRATMIMGNDFFTPQLLESLVDMIITWYLKLRPSDVESWSIEPEEWVTEELQLSWEYQIRPCAELYFQELAIYFKDFLSQFILSKIESTLSNPDIDILTKDSILSVFQLSASAIHEQCNFNDLLNGFFLPQAMKNDDPNYKIIKRRVCLIINDWATIQCSPETRDTIYKFILELLNPAEPTNDKVVRLTALQTLRFMIDDWEFRKRKFAPYLDLTISRILELLNCLEFTECKIVLLNVLALIIERTNPLMNEKILFEIVNMAPALWEASNSQDKMIIKVSILRLLRDLTTSLNEKSDVIHEIVLPLIPICCSPNSEFHSLLAEEGLELWLAIIRQLPIDKPIPTELLSSGFLSNLLNSLMEMTEILPLVLSIFRGYAIISPEIFETEFGLDAFKIIGGYLSTMRDDILFIACQFLEIVLTRQTSETIQTSMTIKSLVDSGLFSELIKYIIRNSDNPNCEIKVSLPILRLMYINPQFFIYCLQSVDGNNTASLLYTLFTRLLSFNKMVYDPKIKKVFLLGLMSFYQKQFFTYKTQFDQSENIEYELLNMNDSDGVSVVLGDKFSSLLNFTVHFLEEVKEQPNGDCATYHRQTAYDDETLKLIQNDEEFIEENGEDPNNEYTLEFRLPDNGERIRFTQLSLNFDPVHTISTSGKIKLMLEDVFDGLGNLVPSNIVEELQIFLKQ